jgi:hypothetical protein
MRNDPAHIADEAHVEHPVRFVDDENRHQAEPDMFLLDEIEETAGRCDQNVDALTHGLNLAVLIDPAEDDGMTQLQMASIDAQAFVDLDGELARRREDQRTRT